MDLFTAVKKNNAKTLQRLLKKKGTDVFAQDESGKTALDWAIQLELPLCEDLIREHRYQVQLEAFFRGLEAFLKDRKVSSYEITETRREILRLLAIR